MNKSRIAQNMLREARVSLEQYIFFVIIYLLSVSVSPTTVDREIEFYFLTPIHSDYQLPGTAHGQRDSIAKLSRIDKRISCESRRRSKFCYSFCKYIAIHGRSFLKKSYADSFDARDWHRHKQKSTHSWQ